MDEFANVALPDEFDKLLSTMRSREISVSIIIQNLAQLKALFEKQWESIVGNCDEFLYLGGNEQSTHEYVSKLLGKETIDTNTYGRSRGRNGSYSTNYQLTGRELMTPDEVRMSRIKTRESVKDIKVIDKAAVASERMKTALVRTKDQFENLMDDGQVTPSEYAEDKIRYAAEDVADRVGHDVSAETKKAVNKGKEAYRKHREEKRIEKNEKSS